jgi:glycosyltransferase involved in cell wall biosynthesis
MNIGIALPTLVDGDAVGNDVFGMARALRKQGHDVQFFAWTSRVSEPVRPPDDLGKTLQNPDDVLIYHHSIGCEWAVRAVEKLPCKKIVKYHNVTPPAFFKHLNKEVAKGCEQGLREVPRLAKSNAHLWADSDFNAQDLRNTKARRTVEVLAPFHQADQLFGTEPDHFSVAGLDDWGTNILLVGRLVPNKNIPLAVRAFAEYRAKFNPYARLVVVGDRAVPEHAAEVDAVIEECGVAGSIIITGKVTTAQLKALYLTADVLLVTSLHEGFCVPLVEAMGLMTPIVAVPNAAIPGTGGDAALYADATPESLATKLNDLLTQPALRETQLTHAQTRYETHFSNAAIERRFLQLFGEATERRTGDVSRLGHLLTLTQATNVAGSPK